MMKFLTIIVFSILIFSSLSHANFQGRYCEMDGVYTDSGKTVYGEFYMYSDEYGESDGAYTEDYEAVYGECYRYSDRYCEMDGAYTESGEGVYGVCYIH